MPAVTRSSCARLTSDPMRTLSFRGFPTVMLASFALIASATDANSGSGTRTRRIAVHFWPDLIAISRTDLPNQQAKAGEPTATSGSKSALFRLSASTFTRTAPVAVARWPRISFAVALDPVNDTTSNGRSWSKSPCATADDRERPVGQNPGLHDVRHHSLREPRRRCGGLGDDRHPQSSAAATFSQRPQAGKLNALIRRATPRIGKSTCCD